MNKPCLEARCPNLAPYPHSRCEMHRIAKQRARDAVRGSSAERGYDHTYRKNRAAVLASGAACVYCGGRADTVDHVVPLAQGGDSSIDNLMPACKRCNSSRGAAMAAKYRGTSRCRRPSW